MDCIKIKLKKNGYILLHFFDHEFITFFICLANTESWRINMGRQNFLCLVQCLLIFCCINFWVVIINLYRDARKRSFYGIIMAGGSLGALFGSEISKRFSSTFNAVSYTHLTLPTMIRV